MESYRKRLNKPQTELRQVMMNNPPEEKISMLNVLSLRDFRLLFTGVSTSLLGDQFALIATPWQGRFWDYELRDGMLVLLEGEVEWLLEEGPQPYWRGHIQHVEYEYAQ